MTHASLTWLLLALACLAMARSDAADAPQWWERGQDTWYCKDDWKGLYLQSYGQCRKAVEIPEKPKAAYNQLVKEATEAIREVDKVHAITVEFGGGWAQPEDADMTEPTGDANTIYQFHFYGPHTGDCHRTGLVAGDRVNPLVETLSRFAKRKRPE